MRFEFTKGDFEIDPDGISPMERVSRSRRLIYSAKRAARMQGHLRFAEIFELARMLEICLDAAPPPPLLDPSDVAGLIEAAQPDVAPGDLPGFEALMAAVEAFNAGNAR